MVVVMVEAEDVKTFKMRAMAPPLVAVVVLADMQVLALQAGLGLVLAQVVAAVPVVVAVLVFI
jgi:hypothetical protein